MQLIPLRLHPYSARETSSHPGSATRPLALVSLDWTRPKDPRVSLGHASLLAAVRAAGVAVAEFVYRIEDPRFDWRTVVADLDVARHPHRDIAFGAYVWNEHHLQRILPALRAGGFRGRVILGGPQVSYASGGLEALYPAVDIFIRGYGEQALTNVLTSPDPTRYPGVHLAGQKFVGGQAQVDLERLPSPYLTGALPVAQEQPFLRWETQRGCPFRCNFCQHREPGQRLLRRELADPRIMAEIDLFVRHQVRDIAVLDPIFNASGPNGHRPTAILQRFADLGFTGRLSLQCRFEMLRDDFLEACQHLKVRLEFGLQTIHRAEQVAIDRKNNMKRVGEAIARLHRYGIPFEVSLIYGLPEQTLNSFIQTVDWCLKRRIPVIKAFPLMLLRGTDLDRHRHRWGLVENDEPIPAVIASNTFTRTEWREMRDLAVALSNSEGAHPDSLQQLMEVAA